VLLVEQTAATWVVGNDIAEYKNLVFFEGYRYGWTAQDFSAQLHEASVD
jgi:hypothetical protein